MSLLKRDKQINTEARYQERSQYIYRYIYIDIYMSIQISNESFSPLFSKILSFFAFLAATGRIELRSHDSFFNSNIYIYVYLWSSIVVSSCLVISWIVVSSVCCIWVVWFRRIVVSLPVLSSRVGFSF